MATMLQRDREMRGLELEITRRFLNYGTDGFTDEQERHDLALRVAQMSGGRNHLEWIKDASDTPVYMPSIYVRFGPSETPIDDAQSDNILHPAFTINSTTRVKDLYVGKYQGYVHTSADSLEYLLSLRGMDPTTYVTLDNFNVYARHANTNAPSGVMHHVTTNAEYAYMALLCKSQGFQPRGNNNYGKDVSDSSETGEVSYLGTSYTKKGRVLTGSGPMGWSHDGSPYGVWDLNGNVSENCAGLRLVEGKIMVIADNDAASSDDDINATYQYVLADGTLSEEDDGTALGFGIETADYTIALTSYTTITSDSDSDYYNCTFLTMPQVYTVDGVEYDVPALLKELCIVPHDSGDYDSDRFYMRLDGTRGARRGGRWSNASSAGVFCLGLIYAVAYSSDSYGARPAFVRV